MGAIAPGTTADGKVAKEGAEEGDKEVETEKGGKTGKTKTTGGPTTVTIKGKGDDFNSSWFCKFFLWGWFVQFISVCKPPLNSEMNGGLVPST